MINAKHCPECLHCREMYCLLSVRLTLFKKVVLMLLQKPLTRTDSYYC